MNSATIIEKIIRNFFALFCHQDPSILMSIGGQEIPLCPRCIGLHLGFLSAFMVIKLFSKNRLKISGITAQLILGVAIGIMVIDWGVGGQMNLYSPTHFSRLTTGLTCGSALAVLFNSYRWGLSELKIVQGRGLNELTLLSIISVSVVAGLTIVRLSNWLVLNSFLFFSIVANIFIALRAILLFTRHRIFTSPSI